MISRGLISRPNLKTQAKCGINALDIRTGLNRCFLAAERLRYEADRYSGLRTPTVEQPPLILVNPD